MIDKQALRRTAERVEAAEGRLSGRARAREDAAMKLTMECTSDRELAIVEAVLTRSEEAGIDAWSGLADRSGWTDDERATFARFERNYAAFIDCDTAAEAKALYLTAFPETVNFPWAVESSAVVLGKVPKGGE